MSDIEEFGPDRNNIDFLRGEEGRGLCRAVTELAILSFLDDKKTESAAANNKRALSLPDQAWYELLGTIDA